jgi:hypothetical protein
MDYAPMKSESVLLSERELNAIEVALALLDQVISELLNKKETFSPDVRYIAGYAVILSGGESDWLRALRARLCNIYDDKMDGTRDTTPQWFEELMKKVKGE